MDELLAALDDFEDPGQLTPDQVPDACIQAAALVSRVLDSIESHGGDPTLYGLALAADQVLDQMITRNEGN